MADTTNYFFNRPTVGGSEDTWGAALNENWAKLDALLFGASYTDGDANTVEKIQPDLDEGNWAINGTAVTSTAAELNILDGVTWTLTDYNTLTATAAELNILDGATVTVTEVNYLSGVTSALQTQLDAKAPLASPTFTGTPAAPTAAAGTDTTQVATTAFVQGEFDAQFVESLGALNSSGYVTLPNGLIVQWGRTSAISGDTAVSFPITFPNNPIGGIATPNRVGSLTGNVSAYIGDLTTTGASVTHDAADNSSTNPVFWLVWGY